MNQPFRPLPPSGNGPPSYDADVHGWAMAQARLIRERSLAEVDWDNVAEEIESVGRSEQRSLQSNLTQLLVHMLKWDEQPERRGRSGLVSIHNHRTAALRDLRDNPSLKSSLAAIFAEALDDARRSAAIETGISRASFDKREYTIDQAFERDHEIPEH